MSKPDATRTRTTNWNSYHDALRRRGALLIWLDKDMKWRAPACLHRCGNPVLPYGDGSVRFAAAAIDRDGPKHPVDGRVGLAGCRAFDPQPQAEDH